MQANQGHYEPLSGHEIRLLKIEPQRQADRPLGTPAGQTYRLSFTKISITDSSSTQFTALSYAWGATDCPISVSVSFGERDCILPVTRNLAEILDIEATTPDQDRPKLLWVDALCINQSDHAERISQVGLMNAIYSKASSVLVFLSSDSEPFEMGLRFFDAVAANPDTHYEPSLEPHIMIKHPSDDSITVDSSSRMLRDSVIGFFAAPWWTRVWTIQEFALAQSIVFQCGRRQIAGHVILQAFLNLRNHEQRCCWKPDTDATPHFLHEPSAANGQLSLFQATLRLNQLNNIMNAEHYAVTGLFGALAMFRTRRCTDPRDYIYGMLALNSAREDIGDRIQPNYHLSAQQLFENAAMAMIEGSGTLDVLSLIMPVRHGGKHLSGLPSWVPDFTAEMDGMSHFIYAERVRNVRLFRAAGDTKAVMKPVENGMVMTKAVVIGTVSVTASGYPKSSPQGTGLSTLNSWRSLKGLDLLEEGQDYAKKMKQQDASEDDFRNMISACMTEVGWENDNDRQTQNYQEWLAWFTGQEPTVTSSGMRAEANIFDSFVQNASLGRSMVKLKEGHIGFGPEETRQGDIVAIIQGGRVPYVLREVRAGDGHGDSRGIYRLLGDSLIHQVMLGEALDENSVWETILLA